MKGDEMQNPTKEVSMRKVMAAERRSEEPPEWALQPIPESTAVGPRIGERRDGGQ
jgi:hypothetical protein